LLESVLLAVAGGIMGLAVGMGLIGFSRSAMPGLPLSTPPLAVAAALTMCLVVGVVSGVAPARRAADLDPVDSLRAE
jgi:putative ABC transport system permease protein